MKILGADFKREDFARVGKGNITVRPIKQKTSQLQAVFDSKDADFGTPDVRKIRDTGIDLLSSDVKKAKEFYAGPLKVTNYVIDFTAKETELIEIENVRKNDGYKIDKTKKHNIKWFPIFDGEKFITEIDDRTGLPANVSNSLPEDRFTGAKLYVKPVGQRAVLLGGGDTIDKHIVYKTDITHEPDEILDLGIHLYTEKDLAEIFKEEVKKKRDWHLAKPVGKFFDRQIKHLKKRWPIYAGGTALGLFLLAGGYKPIFSLFERKEKKKYEIPFDKFLPVVRLTTMEDRDIHNDSYKYGMAELGAIEMNPKDSTIQNIYTVVLLDESKGELEGVKEQIANYGAIVIRRPPIEEVGPTIIGGVMPMVYMKVTDQGPIIYADPDYVHAAEATTYRVSPRKIKTGNLYESSQ